MGLLDPNDPKNPQLPMHCPQCGTALAYMGTLTGEPRYHPTDPMVFVDVHVYRCQDHGMFRVANEGLKPEIEHPQQ